MKRFEARGWHSDRHLNRWQNKLVFLCVGGPNMELKTRNPDNFPPVFLNLWTCISLIFEYIFYRPSPGEINQLLPIRPQAPEVEHLSLPAEVVVGMFVPLQDGTEGPAGLHCCLQFTQCVVWQQRHSNVVKQPLTQSLTIGQKSWSASAKTVLKLAVIIMSLHWSLIIVQLHTHYGDSNN